MIPLGPRYDGYNVLSETYITSDRAQALADAATACWQAIMNEDAVGFGTAMRCSFEAQIAMFPHMLNPTISELIETYHEQALGWKFSGAGGGGYLVLVAEQTIENGMHITARRLL